MVEVWNLYSVVVGSVNMFDMLISDCKHFFKLMHLLWFILQDLIYKSF